MSLTRIEEFKTLQAQSKALKSKPRKSLQYHDELETIHRQMADCAKILADSNAEFHDATYWLCYERLFGTTRTGLDSWQLVRYLEIGTEKEHVPCTRLLGVLYSDWSPTVMARQVDIERSNMFLEKATAKNDSLARYYLAYSLGQMRGNKEKMKRAGDLLESLMRAKYAPAFYLAAKWHLYRDTPFKYDAEQAFFMLNEGLRYSLLDEDSDELWARNDLKYLLALCYEDGAGCLRDMDKAADLMHDIAASHSAAYWWLYNHDIPLREKNESAGEVPDELPDESDLKEKGKLDKLTIKLNKPLNLGLSKIVAVSAPPLVQPEIKIEDVLRPLDDLLGLAGIKEEVRNLVNVMMAHKKRMAVDLPVGNFCMHMVFTGNPGTGKTEVARLLGKVFHQLGFLQKGHVVETDRSDLVGEYIGQTAQITKKKINQARHGVLFIDEAYTLDVRDSYKDYGRESIETLVKKMEDYRNDMVVIAAGYKNEMDLFLRSNPGLRSRFPIVIDFPDYKDDELVKIFEKFCREHSYILTDDARKRVEDGIKSIRGLDKQRFGNARGCRNLFGQTIRNQAARIVRQGLSEREDLMTIMPQDIPFSGSLKSGTVVSLPQK